MDYKEALNYIDSLNILGSKLGLERVENMLERLGKPQNKYKIIHVAGTNGKGSVSSMLTSILIEAGYKTALYTSPHLERYNERYVINGKEISNEDFARYMDIIKKYADEMEKDGIGMPTVFEQLTAMAFLYFADEKVDIAVIEVGLGGRFDATNVIEEPVLSVIASISLDHTEFLGDTVEKIAFEKGGIIKNDCPTVLYNQDKKVYNVIKNICDERNSRLYYDADEVIDVKAETIDGTVASYKNKYFEFDDVNIPLIGEYQIKNCALVLMAAYALNESGIKLDNDTIRNGISKAVWHGRMEICGRDPLVVIDGAHNPDGIQMLVKSANRYFAGKRIVLLMGVLSDKEYEKMAEEIIPLADTVIITEPDSSRALAAEGLKKIAEKYCDNVFSLENIEEAYAFAYKNTGKDDVLLCTGSLYLIGVLRTVIMGGNR